MSDTGFPLHDWQFYAATAIMLVALWFAVRPLLPRKRPKSGCSGCGPAEERKLTRST